MPIKFRCPDCKAKIKVSEEFAGQMGVCPTCRKRTKIPDASDPEFSRESSPKPTAAESAPGEGARKASAVQAAAEGPPKMPAQEAPAPQDYEKVAEQPKAEVEAPAKQEAEDAHPKAESETKGTPAFIKFKCPNCEKPTGFPSSMAGKPATCPLCKIQLLVPEENGGDSFVLGAATSAAKPPRSHVARTPAARFAPVAASAAGAVAPARASSPPWGLIAAGVVVLVILAVLAGVFIGGRGAKNPTEEHVAAQPKVPLTPQPPVVTPVTIPASTPAPREAPAVVPPTQEPVTPYVPPATPVETAPAETKPSTPGETVTPPAEPLKPAPQETQTPPAGTTPAQTPPAEEKKLDDEETPAKPAKTVGQVSEGLLDGEKKTATVPATPDEPKTIAPVPKPPPCTKCLGSGYLPIPNLRSYVYVYGEKPLDGASMAPWTYCDQCMKEKDNKELPAAETERFARSAAKNKFWDEVMAPTKAKLIHLETRHVLLHCDLPLPVARQIATTLDKLTSLLQARSRSVLLTQTRPDTHELVIVGTNASYNALITELEKRQPGDEWKMIRKLTGFSFSKTGFYNAADSGKSGPEPMAIHLFSKMLIGAACEGKAPPWLAQGFASYCENVLTTRNLCYTFAYELNDVKFGENWNQDIRKYAQQGQLKQWEYIFPTELIGLKALDYLTCYSMVSFLMGDPQRFLKMVAEIRDGTKSAQAVEKAYGRPVKDLQSMWVAWAVQQR